MPSDAIPPAASRVALVALGAATAVLQTLAVREGMAVASGNEAVVALLLGVWMSETAAGAAWGKAHRVRSSRIGIALVAYGALLMGTLVVTRASAAAVAAGQVPGLVTTAMAAGVLLAPACVLSGWIYAQLAKPSDDAGAGRASARAYWLDTLGAGISGALLALLALDHVLPFRIAAVAAGLVFLGGARLFAQPVRTAAAVAGVIVAAVLALAPCDRWTYRWQVPGQTILEVDSSPHGALLVTEVTGQQQVLLQREPVLVPSDQNDGEQTAHLLAALHDHPSRVLLLGIPPGTFLPELLKHPVQRVDVVVGDERTAGLVAAYAPGVRDPKVRVHGDDPRAWVRAKHEAFDVVIVLAGAPTSVSQARLFSEMFYGDVESVVAPGGLVAVALPGLAEYASEPERVLHSTVRATLRTSFASVLPIPADRTFCVGSRAELAAANRLAGTISSRLLQRGIQPAFVTDTWLRDRLSPERVDQAIRWSSRPMTPSTDAHPVVYRVALQAMIARVGGSGTGVLAVLALTLLAFAATWMNPRYRPVSFSVASTGYASLALQLVLMLVVQTAAGVLYRDVALVTAAYMAASCIGTLVATRGEATVGRVLAADGMQLGLAAVVALVVGPLCSWSGVPARVAVVAASVLVGLSTGAQIGFATRLRGVFGTGVGGAVYAVDLVGAALAALGTVTFLVPWVGLSGAAWTVAGVKVLSAVALVRRRNSLASEAYDVRVPVPTLLVLAVVVATVIPSSGRHLTDWTLSAAFDAVALVVLAGTLAMAFEPAWLHQRLVLAERKLRAATDRIAISPLRALVFLVLLPVAVLPLGRCYFKVPYLFCHVCPRPCVFGVLRHYVVASALIANFGDHRFCQRACPLGHAQTAAGTVAPKRPRAWGRVAWVLRLAVLAVVAYLYFKVEADHRDGTEGVATYAFFYVGRYAVSPWVLAIAGGVVGLSFFLKRPFCETACPIGATSDLVTRIEKKALRKPPHRPE